MMDIKIFTNKGEVPRGWEVGVPGVGGHGVGRGHYPFRKMKKSQEQSQF